jgi:hypothetical protein
MLVVVLLVSMAVVVSPLCMGVVVLLVRMVAAMCLYSEVPVRMAVAISLVHMAVAVLSVAVVFLAVALQVLLSLDHSSQHCHR